MREMYCAMMAAVAFTLPLQGDEPRTTRDAPATQAEDALVIRSYAVADLVVPVPAAKAAPLQFAALERYLKGVTGAAAWKLNTAIERSEPTLSLVVRQTSAVHDQIADAIRQLRRELDVQCVLDFHIITGPRCEIGALADAFPGEFGKFEAEQLLRQATESKALNVMQTPKLTSFSRQTVQLLFDQRGIEAHATIAGDRRSITLKVAENAEKNHDRLATIQTTQVHSGRSVALRFEAARAGGVIPPTADAEEQLVLVTARVLVLEPEQERHDETALLMLTPRGVIIEEEEELLGQPTE